MIRRAASESAAACDISVVLPCYGSAPTAARSVAVLKATLEKRVGRTWEIITVDDGGGDFPEEPWPPDSRLRLLRLERNQGKGAAVKAGMLNARGRARIFTDVDLPYGPELIPAIGELLLERRLHVVAGDRTLPTSRYTKDLGVVRRLLSDVSSLFIRTIVAGGFGDTQCGLKGFRGDVADLLFPLVQTKGFAFDVEVLYLALMYGLEIKRIPVKLRTDEESTVRVIRDTLRAGFDVVRIKYNKLRGDYDSDRLEGLVEKEISMLFLEDHELRRSGRGGAVEGRPAVDEERNR